jgi:hypothetical protein
MTEDQVPATIKEVGIYIGFMRADIQELKDLIRVMPNGFATKEELSVLDRRVVKLEDRQNLKGTLLWVGLVASAIINIIALYNVFTTAR